MPTDPQPEPRLQSRAAPPRPRILFGDHSTQGPAIERLADHARFDITVAAFDAVNFAAYDLVVPLRIDQIALARAANTDKRRAVLPEAELLDICDDKLLFNEHMVALGFGDAIPAVLPEPPNRYPYVRKARRGDFGKGVVIVRAPGEDEPSPDSFAQVAVEGADEYVLHLLRVDARVRYSLCYRYDMGIELSVRGAVDHYRSMAPAEPGDVLPACAAMLDALGFEGTCCFNYKLVDGRAMILELNPRFGGSLVGDVNGYLAAHCAALGS
ncbi:MAG: hypothetical protein JWN21_240 [Sphingomonas bacterium]|uniref:hypothetical protein n=1 Tax=Sphingomonas bacterium TaxID=1895847 RepID=UPI002611476C|nr:hypothetical protein [Sphingomonas bacterium]MDB5694697.1 hypothetical protein [Sphingomonas bacterium]